MRILVSCILLAAGILAPAALASPHGGAEILWDKWGVPHIFGETAPQRAYAFGWAQAHSHGPLILRLYAQARGEAAAHFGRPLLDSDIEVRRFGIPELAAQWLEQSSPEYRSILEAFAAGVNDYAAAYPEAIGAPASRVLPVRPADIVAHGIRTVHYTFVSGRERGRVAVKAWLEDTGSNGWAIAPRRSASGNALLLGNPHLPWSDLYLWYEAHESGPDLNFYGATLVGFPLLSIGFNDFLGWTNTVNTLDGADYFELSTNEAGQYIVDGEALDFEVAEHPITILAEDGSTTVETIQVKRSIFGPVLAESPGRALTLKIAGLDRPGLGDQTLALMRARSMEEFEAALARQQQPMFNYIYADKAGNVLLVCNSLTPRRAQGDWNFWQGIVPGNTRALLWSDYLPYAELPRVANPESGWLQNANESPWYMTVPYPLSPAGFAPYIAPPTLPDNRIFRFQRSIRMLLEDEAIEMEELMEYKMSARSELADRILDDLIPLTQSADHPILADAGQVLQQWDRQYRGDSRGALLFYQWWRAYEEFCTSSGSSPFAIPWDAAANPLATPDGLAQPRGALSALEAVSTRMKAAGLTLDIPWGEVMRMRVGEVDLPSHGGPAYDTFRVLMHERHNDDKFHVVHGDSFIFLTEFSDPPRAKVLLAYGNATQPATGHVGDQLQSFANDEFRDALLTRAAIEANLASRVLLPRTEAPAPVTEAASVETPVMESAPEAAPVEAAPEEAPAPEPAPAPEAMPAEATPAEPAPEQAPTAEAPAAEPMPEAVPVPAPGEPTPAPEAAPAPTPEATPLPEAPLPEAAPAQP
ncbi:MAG: hypothetical protein RLZZ303_2226 [Candidatus Hydrogenedentota bacterium]|jgi:acyl-homoserine-lactone acylase